MEIGIIGLGQMGQGMARALLRAGHSVIVHNRTLDRATPLGAAGARIALGIPEVCRGDAVITMLSDDAAVEQVVWGEHGLLDTLAPDQTIHVSMSTISPALVRRLADSHRARGQRFLSAPVLGRPLAAEEGKLFVLAAGNLALLDPLRPVFDAMAQQTFAVGTDPEAANLIKISCNIVVATVIEAIGETFAFVTKSGVVEPGVYIDVLLAAVLATPLFKPYAEHVLDGDFEPGFRLPLALKDMDLVLGAARESTVPMPLVSLLRDHILQAIASGYGELDWAALALVARDDAGLIR